MANYPWEKSYPPGVKWELDIPKKTLHQIFEESCAQYGDRPFTDFLDKVMSFRDYKEASDKAAAGFQKLGVEGDGGRSPVTDSVTSWAGVTAEDGQIIGQARAVRALEFGLSVESLGFNVFVTGRHYEVEDGWHTGVRYRLDHDGDGVSHHM